MRWWVLAVLAAWPLGAIAQDAPASEETDLFGDEEEDDAKHVKYGESDEERAAQLVRNGEELSDEGRYASAILAWEDAYSLNHDPLLLLRIAGAYERMGSIDMQLHSLEAYREVAPEAEWERLDLAIAALEQALADAPVTEAAPAPAPRASAEEIAGVAAMGVPDKVFDDVIERERKVRPLPITLGAAGILSIGVGASFGSQSDAAHARALGMCVTARDALLCPPDVEPHLAKEKRAGTIADVAFVVGGASLAAGIVTAIFHPRGPVTPEITPEGTVGVSVELK